MRLPSHSSSSVQLFEITVDAPLAERDAPGRCQISGDARAPRDAVVQRDQTGNLPFETLHAFWKGVPQAFDNLKQGQVYIADAPADGESAAILFQHAFEIAEIFWHAIAPEIPSPPQRRRALLLKVKPARHRMVSVVDLDHEVGNRQLQLMGPQAAGFIARHQ